MFVISSILLWHAGWAQIDSLSVEVDTLGISQQADPSQAVLDSIPAVSAPAGEKTSPIAVPKKLFNLAIHVDYGKILTLPFPFEYKGEGGIVLEFLERIELVGEIGYWEKEARRAIDNGTYTATGLYLRAGAGFIVPFNQPGSQLGLGFRYGVSDFRDEGQYNISETGGLIEPYSSSFSRDNLSATWMSAVLTSSSRIQLRKAVPEAKINRMFKLGIHLRYRFLIEYDRNQSPDDPIDVFTIPGFGRTLSERNLALNAFIRFYPFGF